MKNAPRRNGTTTCSVVNIEPFGKQERSTYSCGDGRDGLKRCNVFVKRQKHKHGCESSLQHPVATEDDAESRTEQGDLRMVVGKSPSMHHCADNYSRMCGTRGEHRGRNDYEARQDGLRPLKFLGEEVRSVSYPLIREVMREMDCSRCAFNTGDHTEKPLKKSIRVFLPSLCKFDEECATTYEQFARGNDDPIPMLYHRGNRRHKKEALKRELSLPTIDFSSILDFQPACRHALRSRSSNRPDCRSFGTALCRAKNTFNSTAGPNILCTEDVNATSVDAQRQSILESLEGSCI